MKKNCIFVAGAMIIAAAVILIMGTKTKDSFCELNVEALAFPESDASKFQMVWDVDEKDIYTITCTLGGNQACL